MKQILSFLLLSLIINSSFSQSKGNLYILLRSGDTIKDINIIKKYKFTNKYQVTFYDSSSERKTLSAKAILKYFDGKSVYFSEFEKEKNIFIFIDYFSDGFCKTGMSYNESGEIEFFVYNSKDLISLKKFEHEPERLLKTGFEKFDQFSELYKKDITYDYKSLGDFISAYNAFLYPDLYRKEEFKNKQSFKFGVSLLPYNYSLSIINSNIELAGFQIFRASIVIENKLSRNISTVFFPTISLNKFQSDWMTFNYLSYKLEGHVQYLLHSSKRVNILLSPGIAFGYNYNLSKNYDYGISSLKTIYVSPYSPDYLIDIIFDFKNHIKLIAGFQTSNINIVEQGTFSKPIYIKGRMQGFRVGIIYNLKKY